MRVRAFILCVVCVCLAPMTSRAQDDSAWMVMTDGVLFATIDHQDGPSGGDQFVSTNWWMVMASRPAGSGRLTLTGMLSLEPATAGGQGYRELFQVGETYHGQPLVDFQHPHDFLMQASVVWRVPIDYRTGFTIAGAPVGEPALGPIAFMHRASAAENPSAPLGHHTLDSTHVAMGVITAALDRGPWTVETSVFRGAEPDENRWDLMDPGALDSWSVRGWYEPSPAWQFQVSHGFLKKPEALEPGDVRRTTASASWMRQGPDRLTAATAAFGRNDTDHGAFNAFLAELTTRRGQTTMYGRFESGQKETALLAGNALGSDAASSLVTAFTIGGVQDVAKRRGFEMGVGADLTVYGVPDVLRASHGDHPVSFHAFLRIRPPVGHMGRMWNMRMARPAGM